MVTVDHSAFVVRASKWQGEDVSYFAAALARTGDGWTAHEVDLDDVETIDDVVDLIHEETGNADTALLLVEEDDEYVAIVRVDAAREDEPRIFVSDARASENFAIAEMLADEVDEVTRDADGEPLGHDAEPLGDAALLTDLGMSSGQLLELVAHEGTLPSDVITAVCERAGCLEEWEALREEV